LFQYIKGTLEGSGKDFIIIENNGIGYKVFVPSSTLSRIGNTKVGVTLYTYFHVREDAMTLYGFLTKEELDMFELLISVSGVGPKAGLSVLSLIPPSKLGLAIIGADTKALVSVPGIGSKTASRIILELKDKVDASDIIPANEGFEILEGDAAGEAVNALISLGYSSSEAASAIRKVDNSGKNTEQIIKDALKKLMK
jgi:Holliday junction DNA helicase RuvA